ncbi:hypothetical protein HDC92_001436 [Pedobacter sp. AK017]|uniref:hypothetical protein n=1 Tax=Pedobacter sp. AK017 TaxID=2723073 RepID=UPI00160DDEE1|nr:hypothetical protein [Pedobacter sp. AK017]MBB5437762.1 hypothetical protein [Pedobacter sp. AK017]
MKIKNISKFFLLASGIFILTSCKKEANSIFDMFEDVTVTFNNSDPKAVVDYKQVNDNTEVWVDFTINSAKEDMYTVTVERTTGTGFDRSTVYTLSNDQRRSFSNVYKYTMQRDGKTSFRVFARNQKGVYIGDGYKKVVVEGNPSYKVYANRIIYLPDTVAKVQPSFFSLNDGTSFSYNNGSTNAAKIDFGIYRRMYTNSSGGIEYAINLYSPSTPVIPLTVYDLSSWNPKRTTKFSAPVTSQATPFVNSAVSGSTIEALAKARTINLNATVGATAAAGLAAGSAVFFLTPEGKYGMMVINSVTSDYEKRPLINVSVKIQN